MYDGMINVYKEKGFTSHDVVAKLRGILHQKKIGHTGTLDPDAQGVLPVCLGKGTKLCELITAYDKTYEADLLLGITTDTQDTSGTVLQKRHVCVSEDQVRKAVLSFIGEYDQIPPMYSAIKVNGKKLYELAREGKEIERKARRVKILDIEILEMNLPMLRMRVHCSKGTYIRTLCHDIGEKLGCGGAMAELLRTQTGQFGLQGALKLSEIQAIMDQDADKILDHIIAPEDMLSQYPRVAVRDQGAHKLLMNGNKLPWEAVKSMNYIVPVPEEKSTDGAADLGYDFDAAPGDGQWFLVYNIDGIFTGLYAYTARYRQLSNVKMFI